MKSQKFCFYKQFTYVVTFVILFSSGMLSAENAECQETSSTLKENTFLMAINRPENEPYYVWIRLIYEEVFGRLGINLKTSYYPLKRASHEANKGKVDGEPARIFSYASSYPNLIRVEESVFPMTVTAYTANPSDAGLKGWESLRNTAYRVEYPRGMKLCENNLSKVVKPERLSNITQTSQGLRKLAAGRLDLYVDDMNSVIPILGNSKYDLKGKVHVAGVMEEVPLYMYVHKKHAWLVPKLADAIRSVKSDGLVEKHHKTAFGISETQK